MTADNAIRSREQVIPSRQRARAGPRSRRGAGLAAILAPILLGAPTAPAAAQQQTAQSVLTVYAERQPIARTLTFVGRIEARERVIVQARVKGFLEAVLFKEGDFVRKGDKLYQIEKGLFQAAVDDAQGALERAKAAKVLTEVELQRKEELLAKQAGTVVARDIALSADEQARGTILSAQANLDTANINLGYTDIVSPIDGKISRTSITPGNVVGPETGSLTLIVSQDPMYITFPVSQRDLLQAKLNGHYDDIKDIKVRIRFSNGTVYDKVGAINFVDVSVNRATDTVTARATMANAEGVLIDGQLVNVDLESGQPEERVVVPQAALVADQKGIYVFVIEDGKAAIRRVKVSGESGPNAVIAEGLNGGEQVIVEGIQSVRPGTAVQASPMPAALKRAEP
jgi:membrane fusion protein, multidrug efflux system